MALPIDPLLPDIVAALAARNALVLAAPPGAGKTTRVPLALAEAFEGRVLVLEPRRLAAKLAARHMAASLGEAVGRRVGYRVRLDAKVSAETRVELVTDGLYLRRLQGDPGLDGVACVVFDEFHERGLESDLALALTLEAQALNPALRIVVMSATLAAEPVAALLDGAAVLRSEGRSFPVDIRWGASVPRERTEEAVAATVRRALAEAEGSLLVFLPGAREIRRTAALLETLPADVDLAPLAGELAGPEQEAALAPAPPGRRKVVLSTAIAETSLTIDGIGIVVDAGWARLPRFDPRSAMTRLETLPASQATATQRAGRAGRLGPGVCYRLWSEAEHRARAPFAPPEILAADLAPLALELALWGSAERLAFLDPPPPGPLAQARHLLRDLEALDGDGRVTAHGRAMAALGLHPRLAHMLIRAKAEGEGALACALAALLEGRDPLRGQRDTDLAQRLELLLGLARDPRADRGALEEAKSLMRQWQRQLGVDGRAGSLSRAGAVLALAYPDRVAQQAGGAGQFRLANGRRALLAPGETLAGHEFLAVASLDGAAERARIFLALPIARAELETLFADRIEERDVVAWDNQAEAVTARRERRLGALLLATGPVAGGDTAAAVAEGIRRLGHEALPWDASARQLQARVAFLRRIAPQAWPDLSDETLLSDPLGWLAPQLAGVTRRAQFQRLDLARALRERLDWKQRAELDRLAPERLVVPSGREVVLDYTSGQPVLAVKLQELFGLTATPNVAGIPVTIQLLSPAGRPVQTTQDLAGFWRGSYAAVRAELRGRYPKHPWPDDPLTAPARRGTKKSGR